MNRITLAIGALCAMFVVGATGVAQAQGRTMVAGYQRHDRHPEIMKAIRNLQRTRDNLAAAAHDYGGHRTAAVHHVDEALAELRLALQYTGR